MKITYLGHSAFIIEEGDLKESDPLSQVIPFNIM